MRLSTHQQAAIRESVHSIVQDARIYLYGSRVDDEKRGGDIDLLIRSARAVSRQEQYRILGQLYKRLGEQKIDLLVEAQDDLSPFGRLVMPAAVPL